MFPVRLAPATTRTGEFTVALLEGVETHIMPAEFDPGFGGGTGAGSGNGATPDVGPCACVLVTLGQLTGSGVGVGVGVGLGVGEGLGLGVGVGVGELPELGGGAGVFIVVTPPQPTSNTVTRSSAKRLPAPDRGRIDTNVRRIVRTYQAPQH